MANDYPEYTMMNAYAALAERPSAEPCFAEKQCLDTPFTFDSNTNQPSIRIAQMMGVDYIFLQSESGTLSDKTITSHAEEVINLLDLKHDNTLLISVELDALGQTRFQRCEIHWMDNYPVHVHTKAIGTKAQNEFYSTIFEHSCSL
jgi:hypothetical protein